MALNSTYDKVTVNDEYVSRLSSFGGRKWFYISKVLAINPISTRFGKPDRIVNVEVRTHEGNVIDANKPIWVSQLLQGLH